MTKFEFFRHFSLYRIFLVLLLKAVCHVGVDALRTRRGSDIHLHTQSSPEDIIRADSSLFDRQLELRD